MRLYISIRSSDPDMKAIAVGARFLEATIFIGESIAIEVAAKLIADFLYDKLKGKKDTSLVIDYKSVEINAEKIEQLIINIKKKLRREQIAHVLSVFLFLSGFSFAISSTIYFGIMENESTRESFSMPTEPEDVLLGYVIFFAVVLCIVVLGVATLLLGDYIKHRKKPPAPTTRMCPQCGRMFPLDLKICPYCGKRLE